MFISHNPSTGKVISEKQFQTDSILEESIDEMHKGFEQNKKLSLKDRSDKILVLADLLTKYMQKFSEWITLEIGKPIKQSEAEIQKCIDLCHHYAKHSFVYLEPKIIKSEFKTSTIIFQPLGVILGIMPWNFPFWQVFRFAIPTILSGNSVLIKHAPNAGICSELLNDIFAKADMRYVYKNIIIDNDQSGQILKNRRVKAVSLTGSCKAGSSVASIAGENLKPQILELGGSDVFIIDKKCVIDNVVTAAIASRTQNNGQSCIAAKRFLIHKDIQNSFKDKLTTQLKKLEIGLPSNRNISIGPLARLDLKQQFDTQIEQGLKEGSTLIFEKKHKQTEGYFVNLSVIEVNSTNNVLMQEEVFGPCFVIYVIESIEEGITIANNSTFGLSASIWSSSETVKQKCIEEIESGAVFINQFSKSDSRFPFGGIKDSGYGRELGEEGIHSFVNKKLIIE